MILALKIKNLLPIFVLFLGFSHVFSQEMKVGADRDALFLPKMKGKRVGIVTNHTGKRADGTHIVDFLLAQKVEVRKIFAPEHGFRGTADAGEKVKNGRDTKTQLPLVSLYGKNKKPTSEQMEDIDVILFDIQDVGVRFYTYISTLTYVMEATAQYNKELIVLDRPNPHDGYIDGMVLEPQFASFVGMHSVPVVYGLTIGEYGKMVQGEGWIKNHQKLKYTLIPMQNYHKQRRYSLSDKPSPNLPNANAINLYPSLCFFEGTEISVGRGTEAPFQMYGSPWLKNQFFSFVPKPTLGAQKPFLEGETCYGEDLSYIDFQLKKLDLQWLISAYRNFDHQKKAFFLHNGFFDKLAGTNKLRLQISQGMSESEIRETWQEDLKKFQTIRQKYILYPD